MIDKTVKDRHDPTNQASTHFQVKRVQLRSKERREEQYDGDIVAE